MSRTWGMAPLPLSISQSAESRETSASGPVASCQYCSTFPSSFALKSPRSLMWSSRLSLPHIRIHPNQPLHVKVNPQSPPQSGWQASYTATYNRHIRFSQCHASIIQASSCRYRLMSVATSADSRPTCRRMHRSALCADRVTQSSTQGRIACEDDSAGIVVPLATSGQLNSAVAAASASRAPVRALDVRSTCQTARAMWHVGNEAWTMEGMAVGCGGGVNGWPSDVDGLKLNIRAACGNSCLLGQTVELGGPKGATSDNLQVLAVS